MSISEGDLYGRLTVIDASRRGRVGCLCACGTKKIVRGDKLESGHTVSCGCARREQAQQLNADYGPQHTLKHGVGAHARRDYRYETWCRIRKVCLFPTNPAWPHYGGRGIQMYAGWQNDPIAFIEWIDEHLGPRPDGHSLDRIDNDGHYEPGNLRWATQAQQLLNRRPRELWEVK